MSDTVAARRLVADLQHRLNPGVLPLCPLPLSVWGRIMASRRLLVAALMIYERRSEQVCLSDIAQAMHMERTSASRYFCQAAGLTPREFMRLCRVSLAMELLITTDMLVGEIASDIGIENVSAFCRIFRAVIGATPLTYRRKYFIHEGLATAVEAYA